jgi:large subunit ribosomal protein L18
MTNNTTVIQKRDRTRARIRHLSHRVRLSVFRSNRYLYAQIIDDTKAVTLAAAKGTKAGEVGAEIAKKALAKKIKEVVFDRGGYKYHGRIKALADAARAGGLDF